MEPQPIIQIPDKDKDKASLAPIPSNTHYPMIPGDPSDTVNQYNDTLRQLYLETSMTQCTSRIIPGDLSDTVYRNNDTWRPW